jgi:hypothetical protein
MTQDLPSHCSVKRQPHSESQQLLVEIMPEAELDVMPEAGHLPWLDDPDHPAGAFSRFFAREVDVPVPSLPKLEPTRSAPRMRRSSPPFRTIQVGER